MLVQITWHGTGNEGTESVGGPNLGAFTMREQDTRKQEKTKDLQRRRNSRGVGGKLRNWMSTRVTAIEVGSS